MIKVNNNPNVKVEEQQELLNKIKEKLPEYYFLLKKNPPDTSDPLWPCYFELDFMPKEIYKKQILTHKQFLKEIGVDFPKNASGREIVKLVQQQSVEGFFKFGYNAFKKMNKIAPFHDIEIDVWGKQWDWVFTYPNGYKISCHDSKTERRLQMKPLNKEKPEDLVRFVTIPINKVININIQSEKVTHSLAIPAFRLKKDVPVGTTATIQFTATKIGTYI